MKTYKLNILFLSICASLLFVQCTDDENGNVITQETCSDGIQNGDETGVDCGGTACAPCAEIFSGTYRQQDIMGRPGINTVFSGTDERKNSFNITIPTNRADFAQPFQDRLEAYHTIYGVSYETNLLGFDAPTFAFVLANTDALQVAPDGPTVYFDPVTGLALTGRRIQDDVIDVSLTLMFGGMSGTRFDGNNGTPQLTSDGVDFGNRVVQPFPYLENPNL